MLKAELHVHSSHSDGRDSVRKILEEAVAKKIDVISITDHDTLQGSLEAEEIVEEEHFPVVVIRGVEISTSSGHLLAYGIKRDVEPKMSMRKSCMAVKNQGGICVLAHPFDFLRHGSIRTRDFKLVDAVEVFNAKSPFNFLARMYAQKYSKPGIAGSDAHTASAIGLGMTLMKNANLKSILEASYNGRKISVRERFAFLRFRLSQLL